MVLVSHAWPLSGWQGEPLASVIGFTTLGGLGVNIFFVISGYLVFESWDRDPNPGRFAARRALRIFPGLTVVVLLAMLVLGPIVSSHSLLDYFRNPATIGYLNALLLFPMPFSLPGAFPANPIPNVVNGSLWTLPIETTMYVALALGVARICRRTPVAAWLLAGAILIASELAWRRWQAPVVFWFMDLRYVLDLGAYFFFGVALHTIRHAVRPGFFGSLILAIVLALLATSTWGRFAMHVALPYLVLAVAFAPLGSLARAGKYGDFSYGIYIYAYPIQQTVIHFAGGKPGPVDSLFIAAILTVVAGFLSWHFVEKRALAMKPRRPAREVAAPVPPEAPQSDPQKLELTR